MLNPNIRIYASPRIYMNQYIQPIEQKAVQIIAPLPIILEESQQQVKDQYTILSIPQTKDEIGQQFQNEQQEIQDITLRQQQREIEKTNESSTNTNSNKELENICVNNHIPNNTQKNLTFQNIFSFNIKNPFDQQLCEEGVKQRLLTAEYEELIHQNSILELKNDLQQIINQKQYQHEQTQNPQTQRKNFQLDFTKYLEQNIKPKVEQKQQKPVKKKRHKRNKTDEKLREFYERNIIWMNQKERQLIEMRKNVIKDEETKLTFQPFQDILQKHQKKINIPKEMLKQIYQPQINIYQILRDNLRQ